MAPESATLETAPELAVIDAHKKLQAFLEAEVRGSRPGQKRRHKPSVRKGLAKLNQDPLFFRKDAEELVQQYPDFQTWSRRAQQRLWDLMSYQSSEGMKLNRAGKLVKDFLDQRLGAEADVNEKSTAEIHIQHLISGCQLQIASMLRDNTPHVDSDHIIDAVQDAYPEMRARIGAISRYGRALSEDRRASVPEEYRAAAEKVAENLRKGHWRQEEVSEKVSRLVEAAYMRQIAQRLINNHKAA